MKDQQNEYRTSQEPFPYKTYEEILLEKERRRTFQHGLVVMTGFFLMCCAVVIGISMIWMRSANPFQLITQTAEDKGFALGDEAGQPKEPVPEGDTDRTFELSAAPQLSVGEGESAILVTDVSGLVKQARASVVGIEAENYEGYVTTRTGSGIILTEDGYIITNSHVISGCDSINVTLDNGQDYTAFVIGDDSYSDIAVIKIDADGLTPAVLGDSDQVEVGQPAVAIGNPTGQLQGTTTFGIISGLDRNIMVNNVVMNLIQTDAAINSGNSGGPLLDKNGRVIGINSAKVSVSGYEGLGFAIPVNTARPIAEELVRYGAVSGRPALGLRCIKLSAMASSFYGLPEGLYVLAADGSCGGSAAGLQQGDVITHINDTRVTAMAEGYVLRDACKAGESLAVTYYRRGISNTVSVILSDQRDIDETSNF